MSITSVNTAFDVDTARNMLIGNMSVRLQSTVGCCNNVQGSSKVRKRYFAAAAVIRHVNVTGETISETYHFVPRRMPVAALSQHHGV